MAEPDDVQGVLRDIRRIIREVVPDASVYPLPEADAAVERELAPVVVGHYGDTIGRSR